MFCAHHGINQLALWNQWWQDASEKEKQLIKVVWWMDIQTDESLSPANDNNNSDHNDSNMFTQQNRYKSNTKTYRWHHTQLLIELELLEYCRKHFRADHYYLLSGSDIPIKAPSVFISSFVLNRSYIEVYSSKTPNKYIKQAAEQLNIQWFKCKFAHIHTQFFVLSHYHCDLLCNMLQDDQQYYTQCIDMQKKMFNDMHSSSQTSYDQLTQNDGIADEQYNIKCPGACEWMLYTLMCQALSLQQRKTTYNIVGSRGTFQHHAHPGVNRHPVEFSDLTTKHCFGYMNRKPDPDLYFSLLDILTSPKVCLSNSSSAVALWNATYVLCVRKASSSFAIKERTWKTL
jgi:hypothetical protein